MPGFFGDWSNPRSVSVDPRKNVRLSWYYYFESTDKAVQYFLVEWKPAATKGWDTAKKYRVNFPDSDFEIPGYALAENTAYSWRVTAYVLNPETYDPATGVTTPASIVEQGSNSNMLDTTGWSMENYNIFGTTDYAFIGWSGSVDPGEYEVRVKVRNGFRWSAWSSVGIIKAYDTRKFRKTGGRWWAVPVWKKTSGTMVITK